MAWDYESEFRLVRRASGYCLARLTYERGELLSVDDAPQFCGDKSAILAELQLALSDAQNEPVLDEKEIEDMLP